MPHLPLYITLGLVPAVFFIIHLAAKSRGWKVGAAIGTLAAQLIFVITAPCLDIFRAEEAEAEQTCEATEKCDKTADTKVAGGLEESGEGSPRPTHQASGTRAARRRPAE